MPVDLDARVVSNVRLSADYNVVHLEAPSLAANAEPGQFVMVKPTAGLRPLLRRPFSICELLIDAGGAPTGFSLLNKRVGVGTTLLYGVEIDQRIGCLGPLGAGFAAVDPPETAWMVAGGVGIAPFLSLASALRRRGTPAMLFYGGRSADDLFYLDAFTRLDVRLVLATEDGSQGEAGLVTASLARELESTEATRPTIYACGPTPMMRAVADLAASHARPCQVSLEPVMGCGMGGCYSCVVPTRATRDAPAHLVRGCIDGPVFDAQQVVWDRLAPVV
ncbi:MAG: dihydroorotate dehydrogenase electron transfer subunit [Vicinamibacterales bacterium]|jgi:dihydroorotate dehydrogenase electron transfer subunit|nr:dihydroorotate dehydrogenase electron transfer subunit [Vicinamibacterales bacterium]MDP6608586.1 dihydroorotate dehydrogenase electron transfer subunit [Vicinamibacterales bacterium]|tara:strand:+ start:731 stop:1561 length:831 start_codon:yes stop_codon:yes gene_type:complete